MKHEILDDFVGFQSISPSFFPSLNLHNPISSFLVKRPELSVQTYELLKVILLMWIQMEREVGRNREEWAEGKP